MTDPSSTPVGRGPLAGTRVVEFAGLAPVSVAGMMLADLGADVIRIDRRNHAADTAANTLRRGRRSICIGLKDSSGRDLALRLVQRADVLIEAYRPGVMERLGLGPAECAARNAGLVYGRLTGWGQTGPFAAAAGHDITYLALTGALHVIGSADRPPPPPLNYVADIGGGTMFLLVGILAALSEKQRSGRGQVVDAAMIDGVSVLAATLLRSRADGSWIDEREANILDGGAPFYRCYECSDGGYIAVGAIEPEFYRGFVTGLGFEPDGLPAQMDRSHWATIADLFARRIGERPRSFWEDTFAGTDACVAPVLTIDEAARHPQVVDRQIFTESGGVLHPSPAPKLDRTPLQAGTPAPERGAHTVQVLSELGVSGDEISALIDGGVVSGEPSEDVVPASGDRARP